MRGEKGARCEEQMAGRRQRVGETVALLEDARDGPRRGKLASSVQ